RFARFGLPLHWTETTLVSGDLMPEHIDDLNDHQVAQWPSTAAGEARQAEDAVRHYTALVSHPAVASITYWGMGDSGAWLNAPAGLVRADGSPKPAYEALRQLIRGDWWLAPTVRHTDARGSVQVTGFDGEYEFSARGMTASVTLGPDAADVTVALAGMKSGESPSLPVGPCGTLRFPVR